MLTWNVHCSSGADSIRQRKIAELIIKVNADFVLLNEFNQDSCLVIDSLLKIRYPFTEEHYSHRLCGDIFYSKHKMTFSGNVYNTKLRKYIPTIKATIVVGVDSVQIFGVHLVSNHYDTNQVDKNNEGKDSFYSAYERYKDAQISRCLQAEWTNEEVSKSRYPVIVMGDMNDFNKSKTLEIFCSSGLKDSWWEGGNGYGATFHDGWLRLRIDHILHSDKLKLQSIKVIDTELSDHNPIVAGFNIIN